MWQMIEDAPRNHQVVILGDDVGAGCRIDGDAGRARFAQSSAIGVFVRTRAAPLWIAAALLVTVSTYEARGSAEMRHLPSDAGARARHEVFALELDFRGPMPARDIDRMPAGGLTAELVRLAQAGPEDPEGLQKALVQEHGTAELLVRELTIHRHLEMLLTLHRARTATARFKQPSENEHSEPEKHLQQERLRLKQAAESGAEELCRVLSGDRPGQSDHAAATDTVELRASLQQERNRADHLEQDLAVAKRDLASETALVAKANERPNRVSGRAERDAAELRTSLQQERERTTQLQKDLTAARLDVETQTALAKANEETHQAKRRAESEATELRTSLQQEREHTAQLQKDLAAARQDVETQTALAKANEEAHQAKGRAEGEAAELRTSLQQEREHTAQLQKDLAAARQDVETQTALAKANEEAHQAKGQAESEAAELRTSLQQEREHTAQLQKDLAAARRDAETQTALAFKANEEASRVRQVSDQGSAELTRSLQKEHERAEGLGKDLSMARATIYSYEAQARKAGDQAADSQRAAENGATLQKSLRQEQGRVAQLVKDLAEARRNVETQAALTAKAREDAARSKQAADSAELKRLLQKEHDRSGSPAQSLSMVQTSINAYQEQTRTAGGQAAARTQSAANGAAELRKSPQPEREKSARLERGLASERKTKDLPAASGGVTAGPVTQDKRLVADTIEPVAMNQATAAAARSDPRLNPDSEAEVARLLARANVLLKQGDIGSARIVLERAAETGNAKASFALAETYDPLVLRKWGAYGTLGDAAKARDLYARAQTGGVKEARERFDALRRDVQVDER
jgi:hypothetical protein